jgi:phenylalanyl-tRNA synthetase beta chain
MDVSDLTIEDIAQAVTAAGFEVEGIDKLSQGTNLVIGQVLTCEPHPDSDHLHVTTVDVKDEVLHIVCGAPNVAAGQKVIVAKAGAQLPGGVISKGSIRGQESNGMICALFELGVDKHMLTEEQLAGIEILPEDAPIGHTDPLGYLGLDDEVLEIGLTPNRSDCLAAFNMIEETAAILNRPCDIPVSPNSGGGKETNLHVSSEAKGCPHFLGKVVGSVKLGPSPAWMKELLRASGMHSINNIVDISNIVMLETGQPMHFYDKDALPAREIIVKDGLETDYEALDGNVYHLMPEDLVITSNGKPIGIAGIMGGEDSKILDTTQGLIIECASFNPVNIRNTARRLGLHTESSIRYQKGIDSLAAQRAVDRAVQLLVEYADAKDLEETVEYGTGDKEPVVIKTTLEKINGRLGTDFQLEEVLDVFQRLHFDPKMEGDVIVTTMPSSRTDMEGMADLSEEVIRMIGYDRLSSTLPQMPMTEGKLDPKQRLARLVRDYFTQQGLQEAVTYTLVSTQKRDNAVLPAGTAVELATPISEERRWIRTSILPSLIESAAYNRARKNTDGGLFELSDLSSVEGSRRHAAFVLEGDLNPGTWDGLKLPADFYTAKGLVEGLLERLGVASVRLQFKPAGIAQMHPGRSAKIMAGKTLLGYMGEIHPQYASAAGLGRAVLAELDLDAILDLKKTKVKFAPISKFPSVERDLAVTVASRVPAQDVRDQILRQSRLITKADIFDVYEGPNLEAGRKSLAFRLAFGADDKTLTDAEINPIMDKILAVLSKKFDAQIRA